MQSQELHLSTNTVEPDMATRYSQNMFTNMEDRTKDRQRPEKFWDEAISEPQIANYCAKSYIQTLMIKIKEENQIRNTVKAKMDKRPFLFRRRNMSSYTRGGRLGKEVWEIDGEKAMIDFHRSEESANDEEGVGSSQRDVKLMNTS